MIEKLISTSRTTEVDAASMRIVSAYKNTSLGQDTHLSGIFSELEPASAQLTAAVHQSTVESVLDEKDEVRDDAVRGLNYIILGYLHNPNPTLQNAAEEIEKVLDNYGLSITGESYATESSLISSLLVDLSKAGLQPSIEALPGCAEQIDALQNAQDDFEATRVAYEAEKANEENRKNASTLKKEVTAIINDKLVVYLRAKVQVDEAAYGNFGGTVGEIIDDNNGTVKRRRNKPEPGQN